MQLKKWLTIDDAAKYLSSLLSTPVEPKDILQLALERHLKISINFTKVVNVMEVSISPFSETTSTHSPVGFGQVNFEDKAYHVSTSPQLIKVDGLWDLKLFGGSEEYIKAKLLNRISETSLPQTVVSNIYIWRDEKIFCLYEKYIETGDAESDLLFFDCHIGSMIKIENTAIDNGYYTPVSNIPSNSYLVVSLASLKEFEGQLELEDSKVAKNKKNTDIESIHPKERTVFLIIIAALAKKAGIDIDNEIALPETAKKVNRFVDEIGFEFKLSTVQSKLEEIPEAMERSRKDEKGRPRKFN